MSFNQLENPNLTSEKRKENITPGHLRAYGEQVIAMFCKKFAVEGGEALRRAREEEPDGKFILTAAHLNNLDVPAALKAMGPEFNIQITGESVLVEKLKYLGHRLMIKLAGKENFTPLDYEEDESGKHGEFNPDNFSELEEKMEEGKTPWIAAHPFALDGKMKRASIGPVYLAQRTGAKIIPTALEVRGGSVNLEGAMESAKNLLKRSEAIYHIGEPVEFPPIDVTIIETVLKKRRQSEKISREELAEFSRVHRQLREQADSLGEIIAQLLPEEMRLQKNAGD